MVDFLRQEQMTVEYGYVLRVPIIENFYEFQFTLDMGPHAKPNASHVQTTQSCSQQHRILS